MTDLDVPQRWTSLVSLLKASHSQLKRFSTQGGATDTSSYSLKLGSQISPHVSGTDPHTVLMLPMELSWYPFSDLSEPLPTGVTWQLRAQLWSFAWADNGIFCLFISRSPYQNNGFNWRTPKTTCGGKLYCHPDTVTEYTTPLLYFLKGIMERYWNFKSSQQGRLAASKLHRSTSCAWQWKLVKNWLKTCLAFAQNWF